jgi:hypothetical protein
MQRRFKQMIYSTTNLNGRTNISTCGQLVAIIFGRVMLYTKSYKLQKVWYIVSMRVYITYLKAIFISNSEIRENKI